MDQGDRKKVREQLIVDAAVMMHGYAALMGEFNNAIAEAGVSEAAKRGSPRRHRRNGSSPASRRR